MSVPEEVLAAADLSISFSDAHGARVEIATGMSFSLLGGGSVCLVGRSGSGKTSILRVLAGLAAPQGGTVKWWGQDISTLTESDRRDLRRARFGYVDQAATLVADLSALENVLLPVLPDGTKAVKEHEGRAHDLLRAFGLRDRAGSRPTMLSGGERQRVSIARALLNAPDILIVDEPTASLDAAWADETIRLLLEYQQDGCALLLASHDEAVVAASRRIIRIEPERSASQVRHGQHQLPSNA